MPAFWYDGHGFLKPVGGLPTWWAGVYESGLCGASDFTADVGGIVAVR
jgi:hypothetical protein